MMHPNMKYMLCKSLFFISTFEIKVVKGKKNIQLLEHVNGEEDNVPNYCCTIFFLLSKLGIFHCVENLFMNEVY